jgi:tetratricopeptide (TPR) repeat protein
MTPWRMPRFLGISVSDPFWSEGDIFLYADWLTQNVTDEEANRASLAYCEGKLQGSPKDGIYWFLKGNCHYRLGELEEAAKAYSSAVEHGEVSSHANFFMALCLIELDRLPEAIAALESQLALTPDHPEALFLLCVCHKTQGEHEKGDKLIARVEDVAPGMYAELYADYAAALAEGVTDPLIRKGLEDAVKELRGRGE